jgi:hypothetical protein
MPPLRPASTPRRAGRAASRAPCPFAGHALPRPLYRKIQQVVEDSGFNSPTDFIVYVLRDLMGEAEEHEVKEFNQDELDDVKRKLRNLGYL